MFKSNMTKARAIVNFQQINGKFALDEANTYKVRVSSSSDCRWKGYKGKRIAVCRHSVISKIVQERYGIAMTNVLDCTN